MNLVCKYCRSSFIWQPPAKWNSALPTICGAPGIDGRWVPTPACRKHRARLADKKWRTDYPVKCKENQKKQAIQRKKQKGKGYNYVAKDTPQPAIKRRCQRCGRKTINYFNCPACLQILMEGVSQEYTEYIYTDIASLSLTGGL